jgi:hypothetical protein
LPLKWEIVRNRNFDDAKAHVDTYAKGMINELHANEFKGEYVSSTPDYDRLTEELIYHAAKLRYAIALGDEKAIMEFAADVGNCAMFVACNHQVLSTDLMDMEPADYGEGHSFDSRVKEELLEMSKNFVMGVQTAIALPRPGGAHGAPAY